MTRVDRLLGYLLTFQSAELVRAQDLAQQFEISERTVYRDIDALCQVGVPIVGLAGEGYRLMDGYYLPPVMFTPQEARALALALSMLRGFSTEGETKNSAETAYHKLYTILPNRLQSELDAMQAVLHFAAFPNEPINFDDRMIGDIQQAIQANQLITIDYQSFSSSGATRRTIEPIQLALLNRIWMLVAYCRLRKDVRNFRLDRIDTYKIQRETFTPRTLTLKRFADQVVDVYVRFDSDVARFVREEQHFTFRGEEDGVMHYQPGTNQQIIAWLLRWGGQMEVLQPQSLRQEIATIAEKMAASHRAD